MGRRKAGEGRSTTSKHQDACSSKETPYIPTSTGLMQKLGFDASNSSAVMTSTRTLLTTGEIIGREALKYLPVLPWRKERCLVSSSLSNNFSTVLLSRVFTC